MKNLLILTALIVSFLLAPTKANSQKDENYLGIKNLRVKNGIAYFEYDGVVKAEKTCPRILKWSDEDYTEQRSREFNELIHPTKKFGRDNYVWSYHFNPQHRTSSLKSEMGCEGERFCNKMRLGYSNSSSISVAQYMLGREGIRSANISLDGGKLIYSNPNKFVLRFSTVNVEYTITERGNPVKVTISLMDLINQLEALSETERKEHVFYDWLNRMADAGYYSYETVLNMHNKAAAIDGL
jgi:hypothetical protein